MTVTFRLRWAALCLGLGLAACGGEDAPSIRSDTDGGRDTDGGSQGDAGASHNAQSCPPSAPPNDTPCTGTISCSYNPSCPTSAQCKDGRWRVVQAPCLAPIDTCTPAGGRCECTKPTTGNWVEDATKECPPPFGDGCQTSCFVAQ